MDQQKLLEIAATKAGSYYRLGKELGLSEGNVNAWRYGRRRMSLETTADIAAYADLDVKQVLADALIDQTKDTPRGARLSAALKKARGAVAMLFCGVAVAVAIAAGFSGSAPGRLFSRR